MAEKKKSLMAYGINSFVLSIVLMVVTLVGVNGFLVGIVNNPEFVSAISPQSYIGLFGTLFVSLFVVLYAVGNIDMLTKYMSSKKSYMSYVGNSVIVAGLLMVMVFLMNSFVVGIVNNPGLMEPIATTSFIGVFVSFAVGLFVSFALIDKVPILKKYYT